jgi:threonine synthase
VIASTASPFKFTTSVMSAIDPKYEGMEDFAQVDKLSEVAKVEVPAAIEEIRNAKVIHNNICEADDMQQIVRDFLKL